MGWVGIQLALLLSLRDNEGWTPILALGACIAAATWAGPYNALWVALLDVPVGLWLLRRRPRLLLGGLLGLLLSLPPLSAALDHGQGRPGSAGARALAEAPDPTASPWRGPGERAPISSISSCPGP